MLKATLVIDPWLSEVNQGFLFTLFINWQQKNIGCECRIIIKESSLRILLVSISTASGDN